MAEPNKSRVGILPWSLLVVCVLAMIGASTIAYWLIPQLSLRAAIRGTVITISVFVFMQLGMRLSVWLRQRRGRA